MDSVLETFGSSISLLCHWEKLSTCFGHSFKGGHHDYLLHAFISVGNGSVAVQFNEFEFREFVGKGTIAGIFHHRV